MKRLFLLGLVGMLVLGGNLPALADLDWTLDGSLPSAPDGMARFDVSYYPGTGLVYMLGGRMEDDSTIGYVYSFDPSTQTWSDAITEMLVPVSNCQIALLYDGSNWGMYIFGGRAADGTPTAQVQRFLPDTGVAEQLNSADDLPMLYLGNAVQVYNNKAYVFGGFNPNVTPYVTDECYVFDPTAGQGAKWTALPHMNMGRGYVIGGVVGNYLYAFGGDDYDGSYLLPQKICERLDLTSPTAWDDASVADFPQDPGFDESIGVGFESGSDFLDLANTIVVPGIGQWNQTPTCLADVWVYDVAGNSWTLDSYLNQARRNHAVEFVPSAKGSGVPGIWVMGGYDDSGTANSMTETIEYCDHHVPVTIYDFCAIPGDGSVTLNWRAQETVDHYGYNLYRAFQTEITQNASTKNFVKLNNSLIVGSSPYCFVDSTVEKGQTYIYRLEAVKINDGKVEAAAEDTCTVSAYSFALANCFPNPADAYTNVSFTIPESLAPAQVTLSIYDLSGRLVSNINGAESYTAGPHNLKLDTTALASGVYSIKLTANSESATKTMVVTH
jgi:hypothetical protein